MIAAHQAAVIFLSYDSSFISKVIVTVPSMNYIAVRGHGDPYKAREE